MSDRTYLLRTVRPDGASNFGFRWPLEVGSVTRCPDPDPRPACGGGLHGLPGGQGDGGLLDWSPDAIWLVFSAPAADVVAISAEKAKAIGEVRIEYVGDREGATQHLVSKCGVPDTGIVGRTATAGDYGTATAGYYGTATAGYYGTATAGDYGTATAGDDGTATAGYGGTATAGYRGTATAGYRGTATAGYRGTVILAWWDGSRRRYAIGYVGEDGIKAGVGYRCEAGRLEEVAS